MSILKIILGALVAVIAVLGGLFAAAVVAAVSIVGLLTRRYFGRGAKPRTPLPSAARRPRETAPDVIEVTATEVRDRD